MKYIGLILVFLLTFGAMNSVAIADNAQERLFTFPGLEHLRHHDAPKVVRVRFSEDVDRETFRVWLNDKDVTGWVEPFPGEREVSLPFELGRNEVVFSARRASRPEADAQEERFTVRYRPPGDAAVIGGSITLPDSPETRAMLEEMIEASRAGDNDKFRQIQSELMALEQRNKESEQAVRRDKSVKDW